MKTNHCKSFFHDVPPQTAIPIQSHRSPPDFPIVVALCCMEKSPCSHLEEACCKSGPAPSSRDVLRGIPWIDGPQQRHPTNSNNHGIWRAAKIGAPSRSPWSGPPCHKSGIASNSNASYSGTQVDLANEQCSTVNLGEKSRSLFTQCGYL